MPCRYDPGTAGTVKSSSTKSWTRLSCDCARVIVKWCSDRPPAEMPLRGARLGARHRERDVGVDHVDVGGPAVVHRLEAHAVRSGVLVVSGLGAQAVLDGQAFHAAVVHGRAELPDRAGVSGWMVTATVARRDVRGESTSVTTTGQCHTAPSRCVISHGYAERLRHRPPSRATSGAVQSGRRSISNSTISPAVSALVPSTTSTSAPRPQAQRWPVSRRRASPRARSASSHPCVLRRRQPLARE